MRWTSLVCATGALLALAEPSVAAAATCDTLSNPIYLQVGDTQNNLMKRLARALRDNANKPITLVWLTSGSCTNIAAMYAGTPVPAGTNMNYVPSISEDGAWTPASATLQCQAPTGGAALDIANSALFNSACTTDAPPATVALAHGPVQAYVMAVPEASSQIAITFEEAYFVFGFGVAGMIQPWNNEAAMFIRQVTKSTLLAWAATLGIPANKWKGQMLAASTDVVNGLLGWAMPEEAIGLLGVEVYDGLRDKLNVLAYRAKNQYAAYYPDSSSTSRDKKNVRDGHYTVWSPTIWMDKVSGSTPVKADARYVVDLIAGKTVTPAINFDMTAIVAAVGLVPDCAMRVSREFEGGPFSLYQPTEDCTCKYESLVDTTGCATCDVSTPCATGVCRNGYCEVQ